MFGWDCLDGMVKNWNGSLVNVISCFCWFGGRYFDVTASVAPLGLAAASGDLFIQLRNLANDFVINSHELVLDVDCESSANSFATCNE